MSRNVIGVLVLFLAAMNGAIAGIEVGTNRSVTTISAALKQAQPGETIVIDRGEYHEHLHIDKPVTLRARGKGVSIIGDGSGNVITVTADHVTLFGLDISSSGHDKDPYKIWGPAGIFVKGNSLIVERCRISSNDTGVLLWQNRNVILRNNLIWNNTRQGLMGLAGQNHLIENNRFENNHLGGLEVQKSMPTPVNDTRAVDKPGQLLYAERYLVRNNRFLGNQWMGLTFNGVRNSRIENNEFTATRPLPPTLFDAIATNQVSDPKTARAIRETMKRWQGSGLIISCGSADDIIVSNLMHKNEGAGMVVYLSDRIQTTDNLIQENRDGILLNLSSTNWIYRNQIRNNRIYGLSISNGMYGIESPYAYGGGNQIWINDLSGNDTNAFDDQKLGIRRQAESQIAQMQKIFSQYRERIQPQETQKVIRRMRSAAQPNHWDREGYGNHYGDFDEPTEGFIDRDRNGIGEKPRPIAGGDAVDHYPLATPQWTEPRNLYHPSPTP